MISNKYHQFFFFFPRVFFLEKQLVPSCSVKSGKPKARIGSARLEFVAASVRLTSCHLGIARYFRRGEISFLASGQSQWLLNSFHTGDIGHATETLSQTQANIENQPAMDGPASPTCIAHRSRHFLPVFLSCTANVTAPCRAEPCV